MTWNIYVIGNIKPFFSVFTMLQMLFNPANNTAWASSSSAWGGPLIGLMLIVSLFILVIMSLMQSRFLIHHIMIMAIAYAALFGVTTTVNIQNIYNGQSQIVSGIPIGIAVPASIFSDAFWSMTKEVGTADDLVTTDNTNMFSGPTSSNQVYGFDGPLSLMYRLRGLYASFSMTDPALSRSIANYVDFCISSDTPVLDSMGKQKDLSAALFQTTPPYPNATDTLYVNSSGDALTTPQATTCSNAEATLNSAWKDFETGSMPSGSKNLDQLLGTHLDTGSVASVSASQANTLLDDVFLNSGNAGYDFMNNMILNCAVEAGANENYDWDSNTPGMMSSYCATKATAFGRSVTVNAANASMFDMNMIPMMAILQFLFFAGFPIIIVVALAMGPNGFGKIGAFMAFGATTLAWMPISAIISNYAQSHMHEIMRHFVANLNNGPATAAINIPNLLEHAMRTQAMADKMLALTPVVTMVLLGLGGAYAATRLAQDQSEENSASKAIGETTPMPGTDTLSQGASGVQVNSTGNSYVGGGSGPEMMGTSPAFAAASFSMGSSMSAGISAAQQQEASYTQSAAASAADAWKQGYKIMNSRSSGVESYLQNNTQAGHELKNMRAQAAEINHSLGLTHDQGVSFAGALKAEVGSDFNKLGSGFWNSAKGEKAISNAFSAVNAGASINASEMDTIKNGLSNATTQKNMDSVTSASSASLLHTIASGSKDTDAEKASEDMSKDASRSGQDSRNATAARKRANSLSHLASASNSMNGGEAVNMAAMSSMMAEFDSKNPHGPDATLTAQAYADHNGLGKTWDHYHSAAMKSGMQSNAAAAWASIMTANAAVNQGRYAAAGNFWNDTLNKFGSFGTPGNGNVGSTVAGRMAKGAAMPAGGAGLTSQVDNAVPPPNASGNAAQAAAIRGATIARRDSINAMGEDQPGVVNQAYADWKAAEAGLPQKEIAKFNAAIAKAKGGWDGSDAMKVVQWMAKDPALAAAIGVSGTAALGAGVGMGGAHLANKWAKKAKAANDDQKTQPDDPSDSAHNQPAPKTSSDSDGDLGKTIQNDENLIKDVADGNWKGAERALKTNLEGDERQMSEPLKNPEKFGEDPGATPPVVDE
ncbi:hypothetical protein B1757_02770 [Acidithiobacillus marinus]|uniref:TraG N-terminal Proteobacteria domain-containing protein n=1 Tax=Acidithiobacillus marinus TaxID=187490 RepID=A0A2I1DPD4_9PROT|nr:conjugal transfer protein TraG N-terminal domain-containing protein [Acidithiobacillus marinus]PKY11730.1 hypothetical protein B1757_02770 [Acidithiobacillus marinus]